VNSVAVGIVLALFVAAVVAFLWTGIRGWLGHYDPTRPTTIEPQAEPDIAEDAA
jgi:hypothetical protein